MSLSETARKVADGIEACDGAILMRYSHPEEAKALGLSVDKLDRLCGLLGKEATRVTRAGTDLLQPSFSGSAQHIVRSFRTSSGVSFSVNVPVHPTDQGARAFVVLPMVAARFETLYADRFRDEPESIRTWLVIEAGLRDYAAEFDRIGIHGGMDEGLEVIRWDELRALATKAIAARRASAGQGSQASDRAPRHEVPEPSGRR